MQGNKEKTAMTVYTCPMHPEIQQDHPGKCPKCGGMELVPQESLNDAKTSNDSWLVKYKPLLIIVGLIALASLTVAWEDSSINWMRAMQNFMAGFFFVFAGFKLLDLSGFAEGYSQYDLLAQRWHGYGYIYPFLELALGMGYLLIPSHPMLHIITVVVMVFSGIGVSLKVARGDKFQCACLGTFIDVPLTYVTIVEDFAMAIMAGIMLVR